MEKPESRDKEVRKEEDMRKLSRISLFLMFTVLVTLLLVTVAIAKDYLYVPCDNALDIIDMSSDTIVKTIKYRGYIVGARFSPDGKRYYLNYWRGLYVIDTERNELIDNIKFWSDLNRVTIQPCFDVSNDGKKLYLSVLIVKKRLNVPRLNVLPPKLIVYNLETKRVEKSFDIPYCATGVLTLKNDPDHIIIVDQDVHKLDLRNGKLKKIWGILRPMKNQPALNSLALWDNSPTPDNVGLFINPAYTADGNSLYYMIIDKRTGEVKMLKGEDVVFEYSAVVSPDRKFIYAGMDEVYKIDFHTGKTLAMDQIAQGTCYAYNTNSDGTKLYVGPAGADVSVYDTSTMKRTGVIFLHGNGLVAHRLTK